MKPTFLQQIMLYRFRYLLGFGLYLLALCFLMITRVGRVPAGLSNSEMNTAITSGQMNFNLDTNLINAPYHFLQQLSMNLLDVSALSIKLPSVILAILSGVLLLVLLRRWYNDNVAIITSLLTVSGSLFLVAGRSGTTSIMLIFWSILLLLLSSLIVQQSRGQVAIKLLVGLVIGLMLYTPLMIYILLAGLIAALSHPHSRYILKNFGIYESIGVFILAGIILTPLGLAGWEKPSLLLELLALPDAVPSFSEFMSKLGGLFMAIGGFFAPQIKETIQPAFSVAALLLIILGFLKMLFDHHALRTYVLLIWLAILLPLLVLAQDALAIILVPFTLLMATGIQTLIREWYSIFPRNPYARLAGLLPLVALIGGVGILNYSTYFNGYRYNETAVAAYSSDLSLVTDELKSDDINPARVHIILPADQSETISFYKLLEKQNSNLSVQTLAQAPSGPIKGTVFAGENVNLNQVLGVPQKLITNSDSENSLRWRVYTNW